MVRFSASISPACCLQRTERSAHQTRAWGCSWHVTLGRRKSWREIVMLPEVVKHRGATHLIRSSRCRSSICCCII